jgi:hypothetical protein
MGVVAETERTTTRGLPSGVLASRSFSARRRNHRFSGSLANLELVHMTIPQADLDALERGLEGVTPGPWQLTAVNDTMVEAPGREVAEACGDYHDYNDYDVMEANAAHIARCDPDTIRELIRGYRIGREAERGWQPIETAHLEPGVLVVVAADGPHGTRYVRAAYLDDDGRWFEANTSSSDFVDGEVANPTHWRPFPTHPKTGGE